MNRLQDPACRRHHAAKQGGSDYSRVGDKDLEGDVETVCLRQVPGGLAQPAAAEIKDPGRGAHFFRMGSLLGQQQWQGADRGRTATSENTRHNAFQEQADLFTHTSGKDDSLGVRKTQGRARDVGAANDVGHVGGLRRGGDERQLRRQVAGARHQRDMCVARAHHARHLTNTGRRSVDGSFQVLIGSGCSACHFSLEHHAAAALLGSMLKLATKRKHEWAISVACSSPSRLVGKAGHLLREGDRHWLGRHGGVVQRYVAQRRPADVAVSGQDGGPPRLASANAADILCKLV